MLSGGTIELIEYVNLSFLVNCNTDLLKLVTKHSTISNLINNFYEGANASNKKSLVAREALGGLKT